MDVVDRWSLFRGERNQTDLIDYSFIRFIVINNSFHLPISKRQIFIYFPPFLIHWSEKKEDFSNDVHFVEEGFPTIFCSRHPYLVLQVFGGTPSCFNRFKDRGIVTIGGTPVTRSRHPSWEPLI